MTAQEFQEILEVMDTNEKLMELVAELQSMVLQQVLITLPATAKM